MTSPPEPPRLRIARPDDSAVVGTLLRDTFGPRDDQDALYASWMASPDRCVWTAWSPTPTRSAAELLGVGIGALLSPAGLDMYSRIAPELPVWLGTRRAGSLQTLAVRPSERHRGVGRALARSMLGWMRERDVQALVGVSWQHGGAENSAPLYEAAGFERRGVSTTFFAEEQARSGQRCAVCGSDCRCVAWLFTRTLAWEADRA